MNEGVGWPAVTLRCVELLRLVVFGPREQFARTAVLLVLVVVVVLSIGGAALAVNDLVPALPPLW